MTNPPRWKLVFKGQDITEGIAPAVLRIGTKDHLEHAASEVEFAISDDRQQWQGPWFPQRGDQMELSVGYPPDLVPFGAFTLDEGQLKVSSKDGDVFIIRGISSDITKELRTHRTRMYEDTSVLKIAAQIAKEHGLEFDAGQSKDHPRQRVTQKHETDVAFLERLATLYGYAFTIKGWRLMFREWKVLEQQEPIFTIRRSDAVTLKSAEFLRRTEKVFKRAEVAYHNPQSASLLSYVTGGDAPKFNEKDFLKFVQSDGSTRQRKTAPTIVVEDPKIKDGDVLRIRARAESIADARAQGEAALHARNMRQQTCHMSTIGDPRTVSGVVISVEGFGGFDGNYLVETTAHSESRDGGYTTELDGRLV